MTARNPLYWKLAALALLVVAVALIGCGKSDENAAKDAKKDAAADPAKIDPATTEQVTVAVTGMT